MTPARPDPAPVVGAVCPRCDGALYLTPGRGLACRTPRCRGTTPAPDLLRAFTTTGRK